MNKIVYLYSYFKEGRKTTVGCGKETRGIAYVNESMSIDEINTLFLNKPFKTKYNQYTCKQILIKNQTALNGLITRS